MSATLLRTAGTTAAYAPVIKRGVATFSDGYSVAVAIDNNTPGAGGTDNTGVAKIVLYVSNDTQRVAFTQAVNLTPAVPPSSSVRYAVASLTVSADDSVWLAWQGTDNALYVTKWTYNSGTHALTFVSTTAVVAANAVVNRFRSIDIDCAGNFPFVATYEAGATSGEASWIRVYALKSDGSTWIRAYSLVVVPSGQFIRSATDEVSIAVRGDGVVSNVVRFAIFGVKASTANDYGDILRELSFNISSGAADSASIAGTWYINLNQGVAAGTRHGMLFTLSNNVWLLAGAYGTGSPKFFAAKVTSGTYTNPRINSVGYAANVPLSTYFKMDPSYNARTYWSATYKDNVLSQGFASFGGTGTPRIAREVVFTWPNIGDISAAPSIDSVPRPLDSNRYDNGGPIGIYGGDNRRTQAALRYYNYTILYGMSGTTVSTTKTRPWYFVADDTFNAPILLSPAAGSVEATNYPIYRVRVENLNLTPNLYGKIEVQVSQNPGFTVGVRSIVQSDDELQYFGSKDGLSGSNKTVSVETVLGPQAVSTGAWYWRARIVSDKGTVGAWSGSNSFSVLHPPVALPLKPSPAELIPGLTVTFAWQFSDTNPADSQSARRLRVVNDGGLTGIDTGFFTTDTTAFTNIFDPSYYEIPQRWTVQLRDADGTTGAESQPVEFLLGVVPSSVITNYTDWGSIDTAAPTITWTFTGSGSRTQKAYRLVVFDISGMGTQKNANPFFEVDTLNWTATGGTKGRNGAFHHTGNWSMTLTPDGVTAEPKVESEKVLGAVNGESWIVQTWLMSPNGKTVRVDLNWYDADGVYISTTTGTPNTLVANKWSFLFQVGVAPASAARVSIVIAETGTPTSGDILYIDEARIATVTDVDESVFTVDDTRWITSASSSHTYQRNILLNGRVYEFDLGVMDTGGLSSISYLAVSSDWIEPALANAAITVDKFKAHITWTNAENDDTHVSWRVYRRYMKTASADIDINLTSLVWELIYETQDQLTSYQYDDYLIPVGKDVDYAVVQAADRFGSILESDITSWTTVRVPSDRYYLVPQESIGSIATFEVGEITADSFTRDIETEVLHVIGKGNQVQIGDDKGYVGTLTIKPRNPATARMVREFIELLTIQNNGVYIKSPFGDVILVSFQSVQTARQAGYGHGGDIADLSVPYVQTIEPEKITRLS